MIDLGTYSPEAELGPLRVAEVTQLARPTTTEEQRESALRWILSGIREAGEDSGKAEIIWSRHEPSVLVVETKVEHTPAGFPDVYLPARITEQTLTGREIKYTAQHRAAEIHREVAELAEKRLI